MVGFQSFAKFMVANISERLKIVDKVNYYMGLTSNFYVDRRSMVGKQEENTEEVNERTHDDLEETEAGEETHEKQSSRQVDEHGQVVT